MAHKTINIFLATALLGLFLTNSSCYYDKLENLQGNTTTTCDTSNITYSNYVQTVMSNNCTSCHSATNASGGIDLSTYAAVSNAASSSNYLGSMQHLSQYSAMPQGGTKLDDCTLNKISSWINSGKPQ